MRFPFVRQHDANDCGPACLAMVSAFYGQRQSIATLREHAGTDVQGTNLAGLVEAAKAIGFRPRAVRATPSALPGVQLPAIAHWSEGGRNHFVVVYRRGRRGVTLGDPAVGLRKVRPEVFETHWTRTLLLLEPTPGIRALADSPMATLRSLLLFHRRLFLDALLAAVLMTSLGLSSSFFIQALVDFVIPAARASTLNWLGAGMALVLLARSALMTLRGYLLAHLGQRIDAEVVMTYHHHLLGLPLGFFAARRTGEIVSRLQDAVRIRTAVGGTGLSIVVDSVTLLITCSVMFWLDWKLTLLAVALLPALLLAIAGLNPGMKRAQQTAMERSASFQAHTVELVDTVETVRASRAEGRMRARGEVALSEVLEASFRSDIYGLWITGAATLLAGISALALLWGGGHAVLSGRMTVGQLMGLYTLFGTVIGPVERLAGANQVIQDALVATGRIGDVLVLGSEAERQTAEASDRRIEGEVAVRGLRFRHGSRPLLFDGLDLDVRRGECCRIAGPSGSGKSTLVRLLLGFYEPEAGRILIDGIDLGAYTLESLRRQVACVSQEAGLLSASIADNIRLAVPDASPAAVHRAAVLARADEFVLASPRGYDSLVGERGLALSGGERQRIVLARVILRDPAILILDEPTNHMDAPSAEAVRALIEQRRKEHRTTILISHDALPSDRTISIDRHVQTRIAG